MKKRAPLELRLDRLHDQFQEMREILESQTIEVLRWQERAHSLERQVAYWNKRRANGHLFKFDFSYKPSPSFRMHLTAKIAY